jgi:uncharacterized protein
MLSHANPETVSRTDRHGWTPLMCASLHGHLDIAEGLARCAVDGARSLVGAASQDGVTALHIAAAQGHAEMVSWLVNAGAGVDARDQEGRTPLLHAASAGRARVVELLVRECGANVAARDRHGRVALQVAEAGGHKDVAALVVRPPRREIISRSRSPCGLQSCDEELQSF